MADAIKNLSSTLKPKRKHLRKYSWLPDVFRIKGSIIKRIFWPVLTNTIFATVISIAWSYGYRVVLTNSVVPLLSVVVGLILVFRNGTSYDRYWEGRKSFASMTSNIRNLSRLLWINVAPPPTDEQPAHAKGKTPTNDLSAHQLRRKKIYVLRLCLSFAFAVKHYLRGEDGIDWNDYQGVLPDGFARFDEIGFNKTYTAPSYDAAKPSSGPSSVEARPDATKRIRVKRSKNRLPDSSTPLLSDTHRTVEFHAFANETSIPLPLIIAHEITRMLFWFRREGLLETVGPAGTNTMNQLLQSMVDQMTAMERVANTPIPISYGIHLKQCVSLYLFALPPTLVNQLGWMTIPVVTVVAFTFMGIEGIADEIEMPFGGDPADLPLGECVFKESINNVNITSTDRYCHDLKEEIDYTIERLPDGGEGMHGYDDGEGDD
ncbi:UPF0187-domain-containing protein [Dendrothele bispora CBS 962.96]|uniref:UPF0187-domain-containing protein n=1 Tax=Dendrothele bispora (strain CBS 962.96) TaxID=1314807 RepID=A0A4S8MGH3_DENBC|nr:UPF0187-domain-containing protein [Dendrothele bispora CBS 962.96]THV01737.1 UPF0187-domain-containing protein [Dendrothele bispora CBS 962.96]